jgi:hypothetical protein
MTARWRVAGLERLERVSMPGIMRAGRHGAYFDEWKTRSAERGLSAIWAGRRRQSTRSNFVALPAAEKQLIQISARRDTNDTIAPSIPSSATSGGVSVLRVVSVGLPGLQGGWARVLAEEDEGVRPRPAGSKLGDLK